MTSFTGLHGLRILAIALATMAAASAQTTVIRAQRLLDVRSGRMVSPAVVVVTGGLIEAVNPGSAPANAAVIDLGDVTLMPGFIDMHVHVLIREGNAYRADIAAETGADAILRSTTSARKMLLAGF